MLVEIQCPECGRRYQVDPSRLRHKARCEFCGRGFSTQSVQETLGEGEESSVEADPSAGELASAESPEHDAAPAGTLAEARPTDDRAPSSPAPPPLPTGATPAPPSPNGPPPLPGSPATDDLPQQIGRFRIRRRLGAGAFAVVYQAHDAVLDREVALKVPRASASSSSEARARFLREPKAAARLRHPHIVAVHDAGFDGEQYYIASDYIEGQTLAGVIDQDRPDFHRAAEIVRSLAEALDYAHRQGIVHRDVKPGNIMVDADGQALLMDFGLARIEASEEQLTQDGAVMGTAAYMAPEQADRSFGPVGPASDQYGLGVVLYELLTGDRPFSGPAKVIIANVLSRAPDTPRSKNPTIPRDLETICLKAMAKRPEDRYADCGGLAEDLERWLAGEPIRARRLTTAERTVRWARRNPMVATLVAAVILVLAIGLVLTTWQRRRAETNWALAQKRLTDKEQALVRATEAEAQLKTALDQAEKNLERAEEAEEDAKDERDRAKKAEQDAKDERDRARKAEKDAERERDKALQAQKDLQESLGEQKRLRGVAEKRERAARRQLYVIHMRQAVEAMDAENPRRVGQLLGQCSPKEGEEDLRCIEWYILYQYYLHALHKTSTGKKPLALSEHEGGIESLAVSPDGWLVASGGRDHNILLQDLATGQVLHTLKGHTDRVTEVAFSPKGDSLSDSHSAMLASASRDGTVRCWLLPSRGFLAAKNLSLGEAIIALSPVGANERGARHRGPAWCLAFSPEGHVWSGGEDKLVCLSLPSVVESRPPLFGPHRAYVLEYSGHVLKDHTAGVRSVACAPTERRVLASGSADGTIVLRDLDFLKRGPPPEEPLASIRHTGTLLRFSPDGRTLASACTSRRFFPRPEGRPLASAGQDGTINLWDVADPANPQERATFLRQGEAVNSIAFAPDGNTLVVASPDGIELWDLELELERVTLKPPTTGEVRSVAFSPDGMTLIAGIDNGSIHVWRGR